MGVMFIMDRVNPRIWIGESLRIELVRAPSPFFPIEPVLHDVVEGNAAAAETGDGVQALLACLVTLAGLP